MQAMYTQHYYTEAKLWVYCQVKKKRRQLLTCTQAHNSPPCSLGFCSLENICIQLLYIHKVKNEVVIQLIYMFKPQVCLSFLNTIDAQFVFNDQIMQVVDLVVQWILHTSTKHRKPLVISSLLLHTLSRHTKI